jgi:hypothetical protein
MSRSSLLVAALAATLLLASHPADAAPAQGGVSAEEMNKSNNPLNPAPSGNLQDYWSPTLYGSDQSTNDFLLRGAQVLPPGKPLPMPQIIRVTVPISSRPDLGGGTTTGLGDINLFDILLLGKRGSVGFGVGPLLTMPTASEDVLGTGKWQAGLAGTAVQSSAKGVFAGLLQWQASFAGDDQRADVSSLTFQPLLIHNLQKGLYLRSTGVWTFDTRSSRYYIPLGIGLGKVWKPGAQTFNAFAEPQWTVAHDGDGFPKFTLYFGLNTTFGK